MNIVEHTSIDTFNARAQPFLQKEGGVQAEYMNVLSLRLLTGILNKTHPDYRLYTVHDESETALCALMTPPHNLVLSQGRKDAIPFVIDYVRSRGVSFPGVNGPSALTHAFASIWNDSSDRYLSPEKTLPFYVAERVTPPQTTNGQMRLATMGDLDLLTQWQFDFVTEVGALPHEQKPDPNKMARRIREEALMIWETQNSTPVCFVGHSPVTKNGMTVGPVYTPPAHRGHGYASNAVAQLTDRVLKQGKWCGLFADAENPVSNKIYQNIGYNQVFEYQEYRF